MHEPSMADQAAGGQGLYLSSAKCVPMGMPWQMYAFFAMDFVVTPATTVVLSEAMTAQPRRIFTDGRDWPDYQEPLLTGYSIGKWIDEDGDRKYDVLEIETRYMKVPRIFDQSGIPRDWPTPWELHNASLGSPTGHAGCRRARRGQ